MTRPRSPRAPGAAGKGRSRRTPARPDSMRVTLPCQVPRLALAPAFDPGVLVFPDVPLWAMGAAARLAQQADIGEAVEGGEFVSGRDGFACVRARNQNGVDVQRRNLSSNDRPIRGAASAANRGQMTQAQRRQHIIACPRILAALLGDSPPFGDPHLAMLIGDLVQLAIVIRANDDAPQKPVAEVAAHLLPERMLAGPQFCPAPLFGGGPELRVPARRIAAP